MLRESYGHVSQIARAMRKGAFACLLSEDFLNVETEKCHSGDYASDDCEGNEDERAEYVNCRIEGANPEKQGAYERSHTRDDP